MRIVQRHDVLQVSLRHRVVHFLGQRQRRCDGGLQILQLIGGDARLVAERIHHRLGCSDQLVVSHVET